MALQVTLLVAGLIHSSLAIAASWAVWHDDTLGAMQRCLQALLAWLLPFAGPLLILHLVSEHSPAAIPRLLQSGPLAFLLGRASVRPRPAADGRYAQQDGYDDSYARGRSDKVGEAGCGAASDGGD
jgi:hypothetical protein